MGMIMLEKHYLAKKSKTVKQFIKGIFEKESSISSKRIAGVLMVIWGLFAGPYFLWKSLQCETEIDKNITNIIEYTLTTGALLLGGSTVAESIPKFSKKQDDQK